MDILSTFHPNRVWFLLRSIIDSRPSFLYRKGQSGQVGRMDELILFLFLQGPYDVVVLPGGNLGAQNLSEVILSYLYLSHSVTCLGNNTYWLVFCLLRVISFLVHHFIGRPKMLLVKESLSKTKLVSVDQCDEHKSQLWCAPEINSRKLLCILIELKQLCRHHLSLTNSIETPRVALLVSPCNKMLCRDLILVW